MTMDTALHYTSVSHADSLVSNINKMRLATDYCDVTVVVGNFRIPAHRVVLSACIPYFNQMLYTCPKPPSEYQLDNVDETAFLKIIEFCYTSAISVTSDLAWPLLSAAALMELPEICGVCCDVLVSDLSLTSCLGLHLSAAKLREAAAAQLLKASSQFLEENIVELSASQQLFDLNENELLELFRSLSATSALACVKLATSWLSRSELTIRSKVLDQLKQICPCLTQTLTDFETEIIDPPSIENGASNTSKSTMPVETPTLSLHWNDSGYSEPGKNRGHVNVEEEDDEQHICIGCGDTFENSAELHAHRKRECEDDGYLVSCQSGTTSPNTEQIVTGDKELLAGECKSFEDPSLKTSTSGSKDGPGLEADYVKVKAFEKDDTSLSNNGKIQTEAEETHRDLTEEISSTISLHSEFSRNKRVPENSDINDSNNNDVNTKTTDVDSSDDIDVVNVDYSERTDKDYEKSRQAYSVYTDSLTGNMANLGQDKSQGLKCQFCFLDVFDDEEELTSHWKNVHGVSQNSSANIQHYTRDSEGAGFSGQVGSGYSYLKRRYSGKNEENEETFPAVPGLAKQPKLDDPSQDKKGNALPVKGETKEDIEMKSSAEQWSTKSDGFRVKEGQEENVTGFLQYMKQYNELAKWYMDQNLSRVYQAKNSECQKPESGSSESTDFSSQIVSEIALDLKKEKVEQGQDIKSTNGADTKSIEKVKTVLSNGYKDETEEEEGPLDMSKTSQDFSSSSGQYFSRQRSVNIQEATEAHKENNSSLTQDAQFLSQHQMELAQYYSRMMAAVAAVSSSPGNGNNIDPNQYGLAGPYGGSVSSGFTHPFMYMAPSSSTTQNGDAKIAVGSVNQDSNLPGHNIGPEINLYGISAAVSPTGSVSNKAYGTPFKVPPDVLSYSSQPTLQPLHRRQQQSFLSNPHGLQDVSSASEGTLSNSASAAPFSLSASGALHVGQSTTNIKSQSRKKTGSRQGFPCTVCNRVFSYQAALFTHMRVHSPSARTYQCQLCHQSFDRAPDLKVHVCPNGVEKPYVCPSCGQTFAKNIHLKRHLATHSGLKPYPCWVCGKRFSRSDHLKRHTQSIHAGSRPHGCHLCGKEFVRKYELNKHMLIHSNIVAGEQGDKETSLPANNHQTASPQNLAEISSASPGPLTMQLPVTCSSVPT